MHPIDPRNYFNLQVDLGKSKVPLTATNTVPQKNAELIVLKPILTLSASTSKML